MRKFTTKKFNTIILLIFIYISVKNMLSFNDSETEIVQRIDSYNSFLLENEFSDSSKVNNSLKPDKSRFELVPKDENKKKI